MHRPDFMATLGYVAHGSLFLTSILLLPACTTTKARLTVLRHEELAVRKTTPPKLDTDAVLNDHWPCQLLRLDSRLSWCA